jgi:hypothetical protein
LKLKKLPLRNFLKIESSVLKTTINKQTQSRPIFLNHNKIKPNQILIKYVRQKSGNGNENKKNEIPNGNGGGNNGKKTKLNS